jgi:hypothetical protein
MWSFGRCLKCCIFASRIVRCRYRRHIHGRSKTVHPLAMDVDPLSQRRHWLDACDRDLLSWFCTRFAKDTFLSYFSNERSSVVCLYQQYKANLKNMSKRHFDCKSSENEAVENFFCWCMQNDADIYLREHITDLTERHAEHKRKLYARYKQSHGNHAATTAAECNFHRGKDRLMARDAVFHVKSTLVV